MENKNNGNTLIKLLVILGSLAAIFLAVMVIYKKYNKHGFKRVSDPFDFDDDFFFDDCEGCYDDDCFCNAYDDEDEDGDDDENEDDVPEDLPF